MATKTEDVKADIKRLGGTLAAHKGWFTRDHRTLSRQLDELLVPGRPTSEETLALAKARYEKLRVHADNVDTVIGRMCELTPEDSDHHMSRGTDVAEMLSNIELSYTRLMDEAEARKQAQQDAAAAAATAAAAGAAALGGVPGGAAQQRNRVREAVGLKPETLAHDAGHVQLRDWLLQFRRYYDASYLEDGNDGQKHGYFFACIDRELRAHIQPLVARDAVVFQPDDVTHTTSLEAHLQRYFDASIPIFVRRHHLFTMAFSRGEADSHFHTRMRAQAEECDLANLGVNELLAQLQMSKTPNAVLKDEYLKTDGSLDNIVKTFTAYETRAKAVPVGATSASGGLNALSNRPQGRSGSNGCSYCGGNNCSGRPSCPATGVACKNCQRLGHFAHVCRQPKQQQQQARQPAASSTSRPQQQQTGGKKGKKKVTEYKRRKATGHAPIEQDAESNHP
jgi:hypothetical protein